MLLDAMMMEARKGLMEMERERDQFPVGMRVLAVDDDPVCLKVLEVLLRRCQYHVTTTNQAATALRLLRENKDMFDLVISDVHMPYMDGFKLLELVGLEMDLPVIMLSVNGETKSVFKGITHGACDYLLKPVRIEELRNVWQHVVRRKFSNREPNNLDFCKEISKDSYHRLGQATCDSHRSSDQSNRASKKRKELHSEEEDEGEDNDDAAASSKKPRVVWSVELHRKFVAAVNQLGIDKAVPKRILELMNVEKLTRENVASHLQLQPSDGRWRKEGKGSGDKASGRGEGSTGSGDVQNADEQLRRMIRFGWPAPAFVSMHWSHLSTDGCRRKICGSALKMP